MIEVQTPDKIKMAAEVPVKRQTLGTQIRVIPGLKYWQFDVAAGVITEAEFETITVNVLTGEVRKKLVEKVGCLYVQALNAKSADRKFIKRIHNVLHH